MRKKKRERKIRQEENYFEWKIAVENKETNLTYEFWCLMKTRDHIAKVLHDMMFIDEDDLE